MNVQNTIKNLEARRYKVKYFETVSSAITFLKSEIKNTTVGIGGCMTAKEICLADALRESGNTVAWHWEMPGFDTLKKEVLSEVFITSANAIAESGEIINIDGRGNRLAGEVFGHGSRLFIIAGTNKICDDFDSAVFRARNVAAIENGKRFKNRTPCKADGKCHDCSSAERICNAMLVQWGPMMDQEATVVLINGKFGY